MQNSQQVEYHTHLHRILNTTKPEELKKFIVDCSGSDCETKREAMNIAIDVLMLKLPERQFTQFYNMLEQQVELEFAGDLQI